MDKDFVGIEVGIGGSVFHAGYLRVLVWVGRLAGL